MNLEVLLGKLAPLLPAQVERWRRALACSDAALRVVLDQHIRAIARRELEDFSKPLLSLPPPMRGGFSLGTVVYGTERERFSISATELVQNVAIFGRSGAGKTNLCFHLLQQLAERKVPFLFLDWKRTARHLLPYLRARAQVFTPGRRLLPFPFNPFLAPPYLERQAYANLVVDAMADAFTLGDGARSVLQRAFDEADQPTPSSILARVRQMPDRERVRGWKISAMRALESLARIHTDTSSSQAAMIATLTKEHTVLELDGLAPSAKAFLIPMVCLWVYYTMLGQTARERLQLVIVVEEAHHVLFDHKGTRESVMHMLVRQCRELGIGMVIIDQHPSRTSSIALGNTYTSICLNLKDPSDIRKAAALSQVASNEAHHFSTLPTGQGIVKLQDRWHRPVLVRIPHIAIAKGMVTDTDLLDVVHGRQTLSGLRRRHDRVLPRVARSRIQDTALSDTALRFLNDVLTHPHDGVDSRYRRLSLSADRGTAIKNHLVRSGILDEQTVHIGRTRRTLVRLSPTARTHFGLRKSEGRESLAHAYWKHWYANHYKERGYTVTLEAPRANGRVDVLAAKHSLRVGIEIETGKSTIAANIKACLLSGFDQVLAVATDQHAFKKVEQVLAREGLLFPRVRVALRDQQAS